jgi:hypothetical protein
MKPTYFVVKQNPKGMPFGGTDGWGQVWQVIKSASGDPKGVDAEYVGFLISRDDANAIRKLLKQADTTESSALGDFGVVEAVESLRPQRGGLLFHNGFVDGIKAAVEVVKRHLRA